MSKIKSSFMYNEKKLGKKSAARLAAVLDAQIKSSADVLGVMNKQRGAQKLSAAERKLVRDELLASSPKLETIPEFIYHASPLRNHESIMAKGLRVSEIYSDLYFADTLEATLRFVQEKPCMVYKIATKQLQHAVLRESLDHSRTLYDGTCMVYFNPVPAQHIVEAIRIEK